MSTLREWQDLVVSWADRKGWWSNGPRNDGELIALMHSEVSEATGCVIGQEDPLKVMSEKNHEMPLLAEEMADVVIRIMDWSGHRGHYLAYEALHSATPYEDTAQVLDTGIRIHVLCSYMHFHLSQVTEELRQKTVSLEDIANHLGDVISYAMYGCDLAGWTLEDAIEAKMAINERRPYRHGKTF